MHLALALLAALAPQTQLPAPPDTLPPAGRSVAASRAVQAPVIDGRGDDAAWAAAIPVTAFREWQPREDADPRLATEGRVLYDAANLYVLLRAHDPHPDSIISVLDRRDTWTPADKLGFLVDSYHDRRTGYEFFVNPAGVKLDAAMFNDGNEDQAWDAVWDVATRVDSAGWTAEFRIPLSQLRYGTERVHTFGIVLMRDIFRYSERLSWPVLRNSQAGAVSQFGELTGLEGLEAPRRLEAAPYIVASNATRATSFGRESDVSLGADVKFRVASNLTLDATVNPDFGQVEADPSNFNLTTVETYFGERRPFFVSGSGLFQFTVNCTAVNDCSTGEGLFYSRRIGRVPQLADLYQAHPDGPARIMTAGKLTGRLASGLTIGGVAALTERASAGDTTLEPRTGYAVLRLRQDLRGGETSIGTMLTSANRSLDPWSAAYLHRGAYAAAVDLRHRLPGRRYEISASFAYSRVTGDSGVLLRTQRSPVHFFQRTDGPHRVDSGLTALTGTSAELRFAKVSGRHFSFQTDYQRRSAGFEVNDLGYLQRADQQAWSTWAGYFDRRVTRYYQRFQWNFNWSQAWTADGLPLERWFNTNQHINLRNNWGLHYGGTFAVGRTYDDRATRGGPALRSSRFISNWAGVNGDERHRIVPSLWYNGFRGDEGQSRGIGLEPSINVKAGTAFNASVGMSWRREHNDSQWFRNVTDSAGTPHYLFAVLVRHTLATTVRMNYTLTPAMTLQVYAAPYMTKGTYSTVRQVSATPRAERYADRFAPYADTAVTDHPGGFNFKALNSNVVFRWEYQPGSVLFVVWSQGRQGGAGAEGGNDWWGDFRDLARIHGRNTFLVKLSYWLNR